MWSAQAGRSASLTRHSDTTASTPPEIDRRAPIPPSQTPSSCGCLAASLSEPPAVAEVWLFEPSNGGRELDEVARSKTWPAVQHSTPLRWDSLTRRQRPGRPPAMAATVSVSPPPRTAASGPSAGDRHGIPPAGSSSRYRRVRDGRPRAAWNRLDHPAVVLEVRGCDASAPQSAKPTSRGGRCRCAAGQSARSTPR